MNLQGGGAAAGGGCGLPGVPAGAAAHGMVSMSMLQSLEHLQATVGDTTNQATAAQPATNSSGTPASPPSRYESQKRRDWNTFGQYLKNHKPPLALARCSGAHVLEFLRYLDHFGKTKVHVQGCPFFGQPQPPAPCSCPLRQAWGSLDALIGRLRAAFEEHGGKPESNPFGARAVRLYLREVREMQAKARGIAYEKKKRKRPPPSSTTTQHNNNNNLNPPPPPPPPAAPPNSSDHHDLLAGPSSLLIPSFN